MCRTRMHSRRLRAAMRAVQRAETFTAVPKKAATGLVTEFRERLMSTDRMCRGAVSVARRFVADTTEVRLPASARVPGNRIAARALTLWPATSC